MALPWFVGVGSFIALLMFQAQGIYAGDSGDLVAASYLGGVPHPSGYPLYTFLGWLLTRIPFATPAWRVGLLSSVPHAVVAALVAGIVLRITKSRTAAVFSSALLIGTYVFFLYGTIQEVYALANLLLVITFVFLMRWQQTKQSVWLYWASGMFGLGLSHHHAVLFVPVAAALWYLVARRAASFPKVRPTTFLRAAIAAGAGLLPYVYVWIAARGTSIINWDHATTPERLIRLFMLTDYGSFKGNVGFGELLGDRLFGLKAFFQFLINDFTGIGIVLFVLGIVHLYRSLRVVFWLVFLMLVMFGPVLYFYAGFPLAGRFTLGTFEQFLLFSETFVALSAGIGFAWALQSVRSRRFFLGRKLSPALTRIASFGTAAVLFIYPFVFVGLNMYRFWGFGRDVTAERLGTDILETTDGRSIVLLYGDTSLFTTQYARYVLAHRTDAIVLQAGRVGSDEYTETMKRAFPSLRYPQSAGQAFVREFITLQTDTYSIYSNTPIPVGSDWYWVPHGLLYRLTRSSELPEIAVLKQRNDALWQRYQNPEDGILSRFDHLLLSDIRGAYASSRMAYGKTLLKGGAPEHALQEFVAAASYKSDMYESDAYLFQGISLIALGRCQEALDALHIAKKDQIVPDPEVIYTEGVAWRDCFKDAPRAEGFFSEYERLKQASEQPLEAL